jgi:predicted DNA binding CopG/RHH family protein
MKTLKPRGTNGRTSLEDALAIARTAAPSQPPTLIPVEDRPTTLNVRMRSSTVEAITARARERGLTIKQVLAMALVKEGLAVDPLDLEDRTPRRRSAA